MTRYLLLFGLLSLPGTGSAQQCIDDGSPYRFQFASGANWELCWHIDPQSGLVITDVYFGGPDEAPRQLLDRASIGQIYFRYDEDTDGSYLLTDSGLGATISSADTGSCGGYGELVAGNNVVICQRLRDLNHLTKVRRTKALRRHEVSLHAKSRIGSHTYEQIWRFSEDGELSPEVLFSGSISRYTNDEQYGARVNDSDLYASSAAILVNWRLDFNINGTAHNDQVDEIEFLPFEVGKRVISVSALKSESSRTVNSENFRGWRISDASVSSGDDPGSTARTRIGYYLDPQVAGYRYSLTSVPWTAFDFFVTKNKACEKFAADNASLNSACGDNLGEFSNAESLVNKDIVTWFSVSRNFTPRLEDYPHITTRSIGFKIIPFDWSAYSPFKSLSGLNEE